MKTSGEYPMGHVIDPLRYQHIEDERMLANKIMLISGVGMDNVKYIIRVAQGWSVTHYVRDLNGNRIVDTEANELMTTTTIVQDILLERQ